MFLRRRAPALTAVGVGVGVGALIAVVAVTAGGRSGTDAAAEPSLPVLAAACPDNQVTANPFSDIAASSPFELAISCLADYGIVQGGPASTYAPTSLVTRAEMAQLVFRMGERAGVDWDTSAVGFTDLDRLPAPTRTAVDAVANAGIAEGRGPGAFDPEAAVTRAQMASFLDRLADRAGAQGFAPTANAFDDDEQLPHEASIDALAAAGVTAGRGHDRFFTPFAPVTREQLAAFLARTLDVFVRQGLAESAYGDDVAPVSVGLDQAGELVVPGTALTGQVTGDRIASVSLTSPCVGTGPAPTTVPVTDVDAGLPNLQLAVPIDRQAPSGRCPVSVEVTFDNDRTRAEPLFVVLTGFTALPELVHVERVGTSTETGYATSEVRFLFDSPARLAPETSAERIRFTMTAYDVQGGHIATSVRQDSDQAVVATFGTPARPVGETELLQVSYATAFSGAMVDAGGRATPAGVAQLNPRWVSAQAYAGPTWSADLLSVTHLRPDPVRPGASLVDFLFDSPLEAGDPPNERVYAYDVVLRDGTGRRCDALEPLPRQRITVTCDGLPRSGAALSRGVVSAPGYGSDDPLAGSLLTRRPTPAPDITAVVWGPGPDQITVTFDEPVDVGGADRFLTKGPYPPAGGIGRQARVSTSNPHEVVVDLEGQQLERSTVATARGAAVVSRATGETNVYEQVLVPARDAETLLAGRTLGPDLVGLRIGSDAVARYEYDDVLFPASPDFGPSPDVRLYLRDGTELVCREARVEQGSAPAGSAGGTLLTCRDFGVGAADGPTATADQVRAATYGTASYATPPAARVVEGAQR